MDTSDQYIKMCKYLEIQLQEFDHRPNFHFAYCLDEQWQIEHDFLGGEKQPIWLPRQDQIQEMLGWDIIKAMNFFYDFYHEEMIEQVGIGNQPKKNPKFNSMEQLWLAFYMHEKHKKKWDGEKWADGSLK